jgi:nitrite reductase/ring-hydroxylating ferredoxin subunit/uncharacterized membrane protein
MINPELPLTRRPIDALARWAALDPISEAIAPAARSLRDANPHVKSVVSGSWLGHSLHPILTDIPIGAFATLCVLDAVDLAGSADVAAASDIVLGAGLAATAAAAITGLSDWSDTIGAPRRIGLVHAAANSIAATAYVASLVLRRRGRRRRGIALSFLAFGWLGLAAYFGGELSTGMHLGVRHVAEPSTPPDDFVDVAADADVEEGRPRSVEIASTKILLVRQAGAVYALANACTHRGAPLSDGTLEDGCIRCPWHGSRFGLSDGTVREGPATFAQASYGVRVTGGRIAVRLVPA